MRVRLILLTAAGVMLSSGCTMPDPIRVMSFNIRYGTADDGLNRWEYRSDLLVQTVRAYSPDVLGMQEVLEFQAEFIRKEFPGYAFVGAGRDDGRERGEMVPILYRESTFQLVDYGYVWLSEEPTRPGSVGWDAALPRMYTWVLLRFRSNPLNQIYVINTHFDHRGEKAREHSAQIIRQAAEALGGKPVIVMGDFNSGPDSKVHQILTESRGNLAELHDTHEWLNMPETGAGTFNDFHTTATGARIDWILSNRRFEPLEAGVDHTNYDGRVPSDHFPVTATLRLLSAHDSGAL